MSEQWLQRNRPTRLERRYEFENYSALRDFLDQAAEISERDGIYPDMGFGRDYVNITIHVEEGEKDINDNQQRFTHQLDALIQQQTH
jgi:pterin-4a-carbinolamine dehydratase